MENTLTILKQIRAVARLEKKKHFNASERKSKYNLWIGIPLITLNVISGSVLLYVITNSGHVALKYISMIFSFISALLSAYQTFFGFGKQIEGHKSMGNRYLRIMKETELIIALYEDGKIETSDLIVRVKEMQDEIDQINKEAEMFKTNNEDFQKAREGIKYGEETYTIEDLK